MAFSFREPLLGENLVRLTSFLQVFRESRIEIDYQRCKSQVFIILQKLVMPILSFQRVCGDLLEPGSDP